MDKLATRVEVVFTEVRKQLMFADAAANPMHRERGVIRAVRELYKANQIMLNDLLGEGDNK